MSGSGGTLAEDTKLKVNSCCGVGNGNSVRQRCLIGSVWIWWDAAKDTDSKRYTDGPQGMSGSGGTLAEDTKLDAIFAVVYINAILGGKDASYGVSGSGETLQ